MNQKELNHLRRVAKHVDDWRWLFLTSLFMIWANVFIITIMLRAYSESHRAGFLFVTVGFALLAILFFGIARYTSAHWRAWKVYQSQLIAFYDASEAQRLVQMDQIDAALQDMERYECKTFWSLLKATLFRR